MLFYGYIRRFVYQYDVYLYYLGPGYWHVTEQELLQMARRTFLQPSVVGGSGKDKSSDGVNASSSLQCFDTRQDISDTFFLANLLA